MGAAFALSWSLSVSLSLSLSLSLRLVSVLGSYSSLQLLGLVAPPGFNSHPMFPA